MKEQTPTVHDVISSVIKEINQGFPRTVVDPLKPRADRGVNSPHELYASLLNEGSQMAPIDTIQLTNNRKIHLSMTLAASPHTPLAVPYEEFDVAYRKINEQEGIEINKAPLVTYTDKNGEIVIPSSVPTHFIIWCIFEKDGVLGPIDLSDIAASLTPGPDGTIDRNAVINKFKQELSTDEQVEIFEKLHSKARIARNTILELYNTNIRNHYSTEEDGEINYLLPEKTEEDIMQGFTYGFYRGDISKMLGQTNDDGLGGGPMSNATAHYHIAADLGMDTLNKINIESKSADLNKIVSYIQETQEGNAYFKRSVDLILTRPDFFSSDPEERTTGKVLKKLLSTVDLYDILKLIDPYATIAHSLLSEWLINRSKKHFGHLSNDLRKFQHHAGDERELRAVEGIEIIVNGSEHANTPPLKLKAKMYSAAVEMIGKEIAPLWDSLREFIGEKVILNPNEYEARLELLSTRYELPEEMVPFLRKVKPTEKQLTNLLKRDNLTTEEKGLVNSELIKYGRDKQIQISRFNSAYIKLVDGIGTKQDLANLITSLQKLQLYDSHWNKGLNIPGVPGFAISHTRSADGNYHMMIGWLLSLKGLKEAWSGGSLSRPQ